jgi:uncharacterized protein YuzE
MEADALYLRLDDSKIIESGEVAPGVILDYHEKDEELESRCCSYPSGSRI